MILSAGCRAPENQPAPQTKTETIATRELTDDIGRKVTLPQTVNRVVTLAPNLTEIVFAIDGSAKLVGNTSFCNYPEQAKNVQKVGDTMTPNLEAIIALKPDIVFISKDSQLQTFLPRMEEQKIAVFVVAAANLDDVYRNIATVGDILGQKAKADEVVAAMKARAEAVEEKAENASPARVFMQVSEEPLFTAGGPSFMTDLIERAGGFSVTANINEAYPKLSEETAMALKPDVILISAMGGENKANSVFNNSPAVRNKKVFQMDGDMLTRPGPRSVDAIEQIQEKIKQQ